MDVDGEGNSGPRVVTKLRSVSRKGICVQKSAVLETGKMLLKTLKLPDPGRGPRLERDRPPKGEREEFFYIYLYSRIGLFMFIYVLFHRIDAVCLYRPSN